MQEIGLGPYSYSLGLYMGGGKNTEATGEIYDVLPPMAHSVEEVMKGTGHKDSFVDMRYATAEADNSWMRQPMGYHVTGVSPVSSMTAYCILIR
ncbi:hypothetical protein L3i20_v216800 [Paenibacillus sp. L3-i20]|nr:hypothetical protein L3i20_v216800 [Paenibacillus sp. L3-i20]